MASTTTTGGGGPTISDCCYSNETRTGCSDFVVTECVCSYKAECCLEEWNETCAAIARTFCNGGCDEEPHAVLQFVRDNKPDVKLVLRNASSDDTVGTLLGPAEASFLLLAISEVVPDGYLVTYQVGEMDFSRSTHFFTDDSSGGLVGQWVYDTSLDTGASLRVIVWYFERETTIPFNGPSKFSLTIPGGAGYCKISLEMTWPFLVPDSSLMVVCQLDFHHDLLVNNTLVRVQGVTGSPDSFRTESIFTNGTRIDFSAMGFALVETGSSGLTVPTPVTASFDESKKYLTLLFPHFAYRLYYDPHFTISTFNIPYEAESSGGDSNEGAIVGGVVGGVGGLLLLLVLLALLVGGGYYFYQSSSGGGGLSCGDGFGDCMSDMGDFCGNLCGSKDSDDVFHWDNGKGEDDDSTISVNIE